MSEPAPQHGRPPLPDAEGDLGWALAVLLRSWHEAAEFVLTDLPESSRGYHVLGAVIQHGPPTQAALASRLGIDRTVMTYVIDTLEKARLVERVPSPTDRRARRIVATDRGRAAFADARARVDRAEQAVLGALSADEQALLCALSERAARAVRADSPHIDPCAAVRDVLTADGLGPAAD